MTGKQADGEATGLSISLEIVTAPTFDKLVECEFQKPGWLTTNNIMRVGEWAGVNEESRCTRLACG